MAIALLLLAAGLLLAIARWICDRNFNHLSLYTCIWTASLLALLLNLIHYNHIALEAWLFIFVAWLSLYLGAATVRLGTQRGTPCDFPAINLVKLRNYIIVLSMLGMASTVQLAVNIVRALDAGNIWIALSEQASKIYEMRFNGEVSGVMYLNFVPYAGCVLAGIYTARTGKLSIPSTLPLLAMIGDGVVSMQRAGIVIGALLCLFSYYHTPKVSKLFIARWQKLAIVCVILLSFLAITHQRGAYVYAGETSELVKIGDYASFVPSLYFYASGPIPCLSQYLKAPNEGNEFFGRYTFASVYRLLAKLGFNTYISYYQPFYNVPEPINVGTYLREIHSDFGALSIVFFPFALSALILWLERRKGLLAVIFLTFLYVEIAFSFNISFIGQGAWYFPLPIALLCAWNCRINSLPPRKKQ